MTAELENHLGGLCLSEPAICLPTELYREVFSYVSSMRDLCNLSVLCHDLQPEAEFFIYRTVQSDNRTHTEYLCDIITSSPHRHMLVRSLSISHDEWGAAPISAARDREFWDRVARLLHDLPYLEELKIHDMAMKHGNTNSWVLSRATFTLHQFDCDFVFDDHLAAFLYSQRQLKRLYWAESCVDENSRRALEDMDAHAASLGPCLSLLNTNSARFAVKCMKQAPLSHIWVSGPCAYEDDGWMRYMEEFVANGGTSSLLSLRLNFPYRKRTLIALLWALAKTTPNLRSLGFLPLFTHQVRTAFIDGCTTPDIDFRMLRIAI